MPTSTVARIAAVGLLIAANAAPSARAQIRGGGSGTRDSEGRPVMHAVRLTGPLVIDGRLDEPAWATAPPATSFTQSYPNPGARPIDSTSVRVQYDDEAVYVGIRMFDAHPDSIAAQL